MTQLNRLLATALLAGLATFAVTGAAHADALTDYRAAVMADTPLAYWHLDEASGTSAADSSGNGRTGTLSGGVTLGTAPPFSAPVNTAVKLATTGGMTAQVPGTMNAVELWVKPSQRVAQTFVQFGDPQASSGWSVSLSGSSYRRRLRFTSGGHTTSARISLAIGSWSMLSVTWGPGNTIKFFVNGSTSSRSAWFGGIPSSSPSLGTLKVGPGAGTGTVVDELALYTTRPNTANHFKPSALPTVVTPPAVTTTSSGTPAVGTPVTVTPGAWSPGTTVTDAWQRCDSIGACQTIPGATGTTYTPTAADAGFTLQLQETATSPAGAIVVYTDATDPITLADGSAPASPPVLPPGTDPSVPASETQAAIDAGGVTVTDPVAEEAAAKASDNAPPAGTEASGAGQPGPVATVAGAGAGSAPGCMARVATGASRRLKLRRMGRRGRVTVKLDARSGVVTVRAKRGVVRRVRWTLDGKPLAAGRGTALRMTGLAAGKHVLSGRLTPRRGKATAVRLRFTSAC